MHPMALHQRAAVLREAGHSDAEVARHLGVPRRTVSDWRRLSPARSGTCPRCWRRAKPLRFTPADYGFLLGIYLGDGYLCRDNRSWKLRVVLDAAWPGVIDDVRATLQRCFPANPVTTVPKDGGSSTELVVHSTHLRCLLPQHGPGKKHERRIGLEPWQQSLVDAAPWDFLRGCIWSDGCCFVNRTGSYSYLSYDFSNRSADIRGLFMATCRSLGLRPRTTGRHVRISRRQDVDALVQRVGRKC